MPSHWRLGAIFTELCNLNISYCKCFIELRWTVIIPGSSMFSSNSTYQHTCLQREQSMHITCQLQNHNLDMMCNHSMLTVLSVIFSRLIKKKQFQKCRSKKNNFLSQSISQKCVLKSEHSTSFFYSLRNDKEPLL